MTKQGRLSRGWLQPSLARRLLGALLLAYLLVAAALLTHEYLEFRALMKAAPSVQQLGRLLMASVSRVDGSGQAIAVLQGQLAEVNRMRAETRQLPGGLLLPGEVLVQLFDAKGQMLWASEASPALGTPGLSEMRMGTQTYWVSHVQGERWGVTLAEPRLLDQNVLRWQAQDLLTSLLISFPLVVLPLWLAVHSGLSPLRRLARRLSQLDGEAALKPLGLPLRYAELLPLGRALETLQERLRRMLNRERAFIQDAAHELRTPLAALAAQAHLLEHAVDPVQRQAAARSLQQTLRRTAHLSQQLLDLATMDQEGAGCVERVNLVEWLGRRLIETLPRAEQAGLTLSLQAPDALSIELELGALHSIVQNLIDNALAYVPAGGRIELNLQVFTAQVEISVLDDGPGIAPQERERVFERFHRAGAHDCPGSGLGLAIVRQAALRLGGSVRLGPGLQGRGAGFVVSLPRVFGDS